MCRREGFRGIDTLEGRVLLAAVPDVIIDDVAVVEGNSGLTAVVFPMWLSAVSSQDVTVDYRAVSVTATVGLDLLVQSGTVRIPAGQQFTQITMYIQGDTEVEYNEQFRCELSNAVGGTILRPRATGTITNDDLPTLSIHDAAVVETGPAKATFNVTLSAPVSGEVTFRYSTVGITATSGSDFVPASSLLASIPSGATSVSIHVPVVVDGAYEANETFAVVLSSVSGAIMVDGIAEGTILNNDPPSLSVGDVIMNEGSAGTSEMAFTVTLGGPAPTDVTINYVLEAGTAVAGADYQDVPVTVTIPAGQSSGTIRVAIVADTVKEANEEFGLRLTSVTGAVVVKGTAKGTLMDDDWDIRPPTAGLGKMTTLQSKAHTFTVVFRDQGAGVRIATLDNADVRVLGPNGYKGLAKRVGAAPQADGSVAVTYRILPPGGRWDSGDNGVYSLWLRPKQVQDQAGNWVRRAFLGTVRVTVSEASAVAASPVGGAGRASLFNGTRVIGDESKVFA